MAVVTVSNPGQGRIEGKVRWLAGQDSWEEEGHNGVAHTSSKEVHDDINDLLI